MENLFVNDTQTAAANIVDEAHTYPNVSILNGVNRSGLTIDMQFNDGHRLQIIIYSILMVISSIGNMTVLVLLIKRRLKTPSRVDVMLMHLAIADLLVTFLMMPLEIGWAWTVEWTAGDAMCRIMAFFRVFGLYLSSFILVCISIDRYYAVRRPLNLMNAYQRGRIMIVIAWMLSGLCSAPQIVVFHTKTHPDVTDYVQCVSWSNFDVDGYDIVYSLVCMLMNYALPLIIIIFCYASIYQTIHQNNRKIIAGQIRRSNVNVLSRARKRTLKMTITIVIVFIVCWTPFYVMCMWYWFDTIAAREVDQRVQKGLFIFASTNSCMNPIVYGFYNIRRSKQNNNGFSLKRRTTTNGCESVPEKLTISTCQLQTTEITMHNQSL